MTHSKHEILLQILKFLPSIAKQIDEIEHIIREARDIPVLPQIQVHYKDGKRIHESN